MNSTNFAGKFSWKKALIFSLTAGLFAAAITITLQVRSVMVAGSNSSVALGSGSSFAAPALPARLKIPAINVDAPVVEVGLTKEGDMGAPTNAVDVGWYKNGPRPGMPGSAVIDGHLDTKNVPQAVFYNIQKLKTGDLVQIVDADGATQEFKVVETKIYDYDANTAEIFSSDTSKARLNLITCGGVWDKELHLYNKRVVIFTERVA